MSWKVDVSDILKDHLKSIVNHNTGKPDASDYITFILVPVFFGVLMSLFKVWLNDNMIANLIAGISIFIGLLLNVITILLDIVKRQDTKPLKKELIRELITHASFEVLISILIIVTLPTTLIKYHVIKYISHFFVYGLTMLFLFTLLMILKRLYLIFQSEIK